jgi:hypothetical protein
MTEWVTVKVPASDRDECKEIRPDSATFGDCLVAGAKLLSGGEGVQEAPKDFQPVGSADPNELVDAIAAEIDTAAFDGGMSDEKADRILRRLDDLETEFNALREGLQR